MATISARGTTARSGRAASYSSAATCRRRRSSKGSKAASLDVSRCPMSDTRSGIASVVQRTRPVRIDGTVVAAHFLGDTAVFVQGEQSLSLVPQEGEARTIGVHAGAILCSAAQDDRVITSGDDGTVAATGADGAVTTLATDGQRRWIDHVVT